MAPEPGAETCNGLDDDCDGAVDLPLVPPGSDCEIEVSGVGKCRGKWACQGTTGWSCIGKPPKVETCNLVDDDCDGETDEDFKDATGTHDMDPEHCGGCGHSCADEIPHAASVACEPSSQGPVCTALTCMDGYVKTSDARCEPLMSRLCFPCEQDSDCGTEGNRRLPDGPAKACGRICDPLSPFGDGCPDGYFCQNFDSNGQCVPVSGSCACTIETAGMKRVCLSSSALGTCFGEETCEPWTGWTGGCTAPLPSAEICNGIDDNCDGLVDEGMLLQGTACVNFVPGVGSCPKRWDCAWASGWWCIGQEPETETCNYADDDCDGETDEDFKNADGAYDDPENCGSCGNDCRGRFPNAATVVCDTSQTDPACAVSECLAGFRRRDPTHCVAWTPTLCAPCGSDADCGQAGARCLELGPGKYCGRDCAAGAVLGQDCPEGYQCAALEDGIAQCMPMSGTCDCSPANAGGIRSFSRTNSHGSCPGTQICDPVEGWTDCTAREPTAETCNGLDDDCDGFVDEAVTPPTDACARSGIDPVEGKIWTCTADWKCRDAGLGTTWVCDAPVPQPEVCNGRDDNCNGQVDELFKEPGTDRYVALQHCGKCGVSCSSLVTHAKLRCDTTGPEPRCVLDSCDPGYFKASDLSCLPLPDSLCVPCASDATCEVPGDVCFSPGPDSRPGCLWDCSPGSLHPAFEGTGTACPPGYVCRETDGFGQPFFKCVPRSGDCACLGPDAGAIRSCFVTDAHGTSMGTQTCDPLSGWGGCTAALPTMETCNDADDDCNGLVDEAWPEKGTPCAVGTGICLRHGVFRCAADGTRTECGTIAGPPGQEACNLLDDDCDGLTDEGFIDAEGRYVSDTACGDCLTDCTRLWGEGGQHVRGRCDTGPDHPVCKYTCDAGWADVDGNPANGCELQIDAFGIYVATAANGGADTQTCGAFSKPCATIGQGMAQANAFWKKRVLVSAGVYPESVKLVPGISLLGGYNAVTWSRDPKANVTLLTPVSGAPEKHRKVISGTGQTQPAELSGLTIVGMDLDGPGGLTGGNSYAIWVKDCSSALTIKDNVILAGRGAPGADGSAGWPRTKGSDGKPGGTGFVAEPCGGWGGFGGSGGYGACGGSGGQGGSASCPVVGHTQASGKSGNGEHAGPGGSGGQDVAAIGPCVLPDFGGVKAGNGETGKPGQEGEAGVDGAGCSSAAGTLSGDEWTGTSGEMGKGGKAGAGGGGGGAGGGVVADGKEGCLTAVGGSGGGGGAGGCGGSGGKGGSSGGDRSGSSSCAPSRAPIPCRSSRATPSYEAPGAREAEAEKAAPAARGARAERGESAVRMQGPVGPVGQEGRGDWAERGVVDAAGLPTAWSRLAMASTRTSAKASRRTSSMPRGPADWAAFRERA